MIILRLENAQTPLAAATLLTNDGHYVVPVPPREKGARDTGWQNLRLTVEELPHYFNGVPGSQNIGVLDGIWQKSPLLLADIDLDCPETLITYQLFALPTKLIWGRASKPRSHHFYLVPNPLHSKQYNDPLREKDKATRGQAMLIELRCLSKAGAVGLQTLAPGSYHPSGELIRFDDHGAPAVVDSAVLTTTVAEAAAAALLARYWPQTGQGRHETMLALAGWLAAQGVAQWKLERAQRFCRGVYHAILDPDPRQMTRSDGEVRSTFEDHAAGRPVTGRGRLAEKFDGLVLSKVQDWLGLSRGAGASIRSATATAATQDAAASLRGTIDLLGPPLNDHGNAQRLIAFCGQDMLYCHEMRCWFVWDGARWKKDQTGRAVQLAVQAMWMFLGQALTTGDKALCGFAKQSLNHNRVTSLLAMAQSERVIETDQMDTHPYLLNCLSGTIQLDTATLRSHRREDHITKLVHLNYNPVAECPLFQKFLSEIQPNDSLRDFIGRALGYSLTGSTKEKAIFIAYGLTDSGKTTLLSTIHGVIPEYSTIIQADTLMRRMHDNNSQSDLADLRGARFVRTSECETGQRLSQARLKGITQGGDSLIKAARKYENQIVFRETHKLWIDTNPKPEIPDPDDQATLNRLYPVPFIASIAKDKIDRNLGDKLKTEREGILAWLVSYARDWYVRGLNKPPEVEAATDEWRRENDNVGRFVEERCEVGDAFSAPAGPLYSAYKLWAENSGEKREGTRNAQAFKVSLEKRGYQWCHTNRGNRYGGLRLLKADDHDADPRDEDVPPPDVKAAGPGTESATKRRSLSDIIA
jgi:putative DNA primase/helicase